MTILFTADDLKNQLGAATVDADRAEHVERVVWGWLMPVLDLTERPDPVTDDVFAWAVELAAIAYVNPAGLRSQQLGPGSQTFSLERRQEILAEVAGGGTPVGVPNSPEGSFPDALSYPDPTW